MTQSITALRARSARGARSAGPTAGADRRIVVLVSALLLFEASMYSAVTPVLPHYAHVLHAAKPALGLLTGAYPAGIVPGSLLGAWLAARAGVRRTTVVGLLVFAAAIIAFGFATRLGMLDALRFAQGVGCGLIWGGGLTWAIAVAPRERRGEVLGAVIGAAIFGTLLGPVLGTLAVTLGTGLVFTLVGLVSLGLAAWTLRHPEPSPEPLPDTPAPTRTPARTVLHTPRILLGAWLIGLEAATVGATSTLIPLRLARFGASEIVVGATFLVSSLISTQLATPVGRLVDRRGARTPLCVGLTATAVLLALLTVPHSALGLALLSMIALGGPLTAYTIPAMSVITEACERVGVPLVIATMMLNLAWATGEMVGAPSAAKLAQATSDSVPLLVLSGIMLLTLAPVIRARLMTGAAPSAATQPRDCPLGSPAR